MIKKEVKSVYEQALEDLCKKAKVRSPVNLIGKKIVITLKGEGIDDYSIFSKIGRITLSRNKPGHLSFYLLLSHNFNGYAIVLKYFPDEKWTYFIEKGGDSENILVESITFPSSWWKIF